MFAQPDDDDDDDDDDNGEIASFGYWFDFKRSLKHAFLLLTSFNFVFSNSNCFTPCICFAEIFLYIALFFGEILLSERRNLTRDASRGRGVSRRTSVVRIGITNYEHVLASPTRKLHVRSTALSDSSSRNVIDKMISFPSKYRRRSTLLLQN